MRPSATRPCAIAAVALMGLVSPLTPALAAEYLCREVGADWTWFSDHVAAAVDYVIVGQPGRRYEVGTGLSMWGAPRGFRSTHAGEASVTAWGMGALHIRRADDGPPFKVCAGASHLKPIDIIKLEF